jgi:hypothetical protein
VLQCNVELHAVTTAGAGGAAAAALVPTATVPDCRFSLQVSNSRPTSTRLASFTQRLLLPVGVDLFRRLAGNAIRKTSPVRSELRKSLCKKYLLLWSPDCKSATTTRTSYSRSSTATPLTSFSDVLECNVELHAVHTAAIAATSRNGFAQ